MDNKSIFTERNWLRDNDVYLHASIGLGCCRLLQISS